MAENTEKEEWTEPKESPKPKRDNFGRPTAITKDVLAKLEWSFLLGCSDEEACLFANIAPCTLYRYQEKFPDFRERKRVLKKNPVMVARTKVFKGLENEEDAKFALDFLKAKRKKEFGNVKEEQDTTINVTVVESFPEKEGPDE